MKKKEEQIVLDMKVAPREFKRLLYTGVVRSFAKTITEPVTNSDSSYKRKHQIDDASGLVEEAFKLQKGEKFDLTEKKRQLAGTKPERVIELHVYAAQRDGRKARTIEVVDHAEGLGSQELKDALEYLAADKEVVSKGRPGRSLFGRGLSDVLAGHDDGVVHSLKDGIYSKAEITFGKGQNAPKIVISNPQITAKALQEFHLGQGHNGTCIQFKLSEDCHLPQEGRIGTDLSQFYMLRLINADPNTKIKLYRYSSRGPASETVLDYDFPQGNVIDKFSLTIDEPIKGQHLQPLEIDAIVCRVEPHLRLPGAEAGEGRANGFLIVDDKDAVIDLTLLPDYDKLPYLSGIYGVIRIKNLRPVLKWYLDGGKDSALSVSRDGFEPKHEFTKLLHGELEKKLAPIYKKEEERFKKANAAEISEEVKKKVDGAIRELNKYLKELGEGDGDDEDTQEEPQLNKDLQFVPNKVKLREGRPRRVFLYLKKAIAKADGNVLYDCDNKAIEITPLNENISDGKKSGDFLVFEVRLKSDTLHEKGKLTALAECQGGDQETHLEIQDVVSSVTAVPPESMEFRPREAKGQPNRENSISLAINPAVVPVGRKIKISLEKIHGSIAVKNGAKKEDELTVVFEKSHIIQGIGRIPIPWEGTAWGQSARISAETKLPAGGQVIQAHGKISVEMPEDEGGMIKEWRYVDSATLPDKCSDLVDGILYISKDHHLNKIAFGQDKAELDERLKTDPTAQFRFACLLVEQAVFSYAESSIRMNKETYSPVVPVGSIRSIVERKTHEWAPKIVRFIMNAERS